MLVKLQMARSVWSPAAILVSLTVLVCMKCYRGILDAFLTAVSGMQDKLWNGTPYVELSCHPTGVWSVCLQGWGSGS